MSVTTANPNLPDLTCIDVLDTLSGALSRVGTVCIPVSGRSMGMSFAAVREIVVVPFDPAAVRFGSVIVFQRDGRWIVHRVLYILDRNGARGYVTKGDGLAAPDRPRVEAAAIRGIVVGLRLENGTTVDLASRAARWRGQARAARGWIAVAVTAVRSALRRER